MTGVTPQGPEINRPIAGCFKQILAASNPLGSCRRELYEREADVMPPLVAAGDLARLLFQSRIPFTAFHIKKE